VFDGSHRGRIVLFEQAAPGSIADRGSTGGRIHDVGEEHRHEHSVDVDSAWRGRPSDELGNRIEDGLVVTGFAAHVEVAWDLDEASAGDVLGEVSGLAHRYDRIAGSVHDERRDAHSTERVSDIYVQIVVHDRRDRPR